MKYTFFIANDFPEGVSKNARIKSYAKGLRDLGNDVEILVGYSSIINRNGVNADVTGNWEGIPFRYLSGTVRYRNSVLHKSLIILRFWIGLLKTAFKHDFNQRIAVLYNSYITDFHFWLPLLKRRSKHLSVIYTELPSLVIPGKRQRWIEHRLAKYADSILVVSENLYNFFNKRNSGTRLVTPVVVDSNRFDATSYQPSHTLGYLGTFGEKDGIEFMISGFLKAKDLLPELKLKLMGFISEPEIHPYLEEVLAKHTAISYVGTIRSDQLATHLSSCDSLIMNRIDTEYARTGFPIKLAEYLSTGIPAIVTDFEQYHSYIPHNWVYYYKPEDENAYVAAILERYQNESEALERAQRAKNQIDLVFGEEHAAKELNTIFEQMMKPHGA